MRLQSIVSEVVDRVKAIFGLYICHITSITAVCPCIEGVAMPWIGGVLGGSRYEEG